MRNCPWCDSEPEFVSDGQTSEVFCANPKCVVRPSTGKLRKDAAYAVWNDMPTINSLYKELNAIRLQLSRPHDK